MSRRTRCWCALGLGGLLAAGLCAACSDDDDSTRDAGVDATADACVVAAIPVELPCTDAFDDVYGDPGLGRSWAPSEVVSDNYKPPVKTIRIQHWPGVVVG